MVSTGYGALGVWSMGIGMQHLGAKLPHAIQLLCEAGTERLQGVRPAQSVLLLHHLSRSVKVVQHLIREGDLRFKGEEGDVGLGSLQQAARKHQAAIPQRAPQQQGLHSRPHQEGTS